MLDKIRAQFLGLLHTNGCEWSIVVQHDSVIAWNSLRVQDEKDGPWNRWAVGGEWLRWRRRSAKNDGPQIAKEKLYKSVDTQKAWLSTTKDTIGVIVMRHEYEDGIKAKIGAEND